MKKTMKRVKIIKIILYGSTLLVDLYLTNYGITKAINATDDAVKCGYCMFAAFIVYAFIMDSKKFIKISKAKGE